MRAGPPVPTWGAILRWQGRPVFVPEALSTRPILPAAPSLAFVLGGQRPEDSPSHNILWAQAPASVLNRTHQYEMLDTDRPEDVEVSNERAFASLLVGRLAPHDPSARRVSIMAVQAVMASDIPSSTALNMAARLFFLLPPNHSKHFREATVDKVLWDPPGCEHRGLEIHCSYRKSGCRRRRPGPLHTGGEPKERLEVGGRWEFSEALRSLTSFPWPPESLFYLLQRDRMARVWSTGGAPTLTCEMRNLAHRDPTVAAPHSSHLLLWAAVLQFGPQPGDEYRFNLWPLPATTFIMRPDGGPWDFWSSLFWSSCLRRLGEARWDTRIQLPDAAAHPDAYYAFFGSEMAAFPVADCSMEEVPSGVWPRLWRKWDPVTFRYEADRQFSLALVPARILTAWMEQDIILLLPIRGVRALLKIPREHRGSTLWRAMEFPLEGSGTIPEVNRQGDFVKWHGGSRPPQRAIGILTIAYSGPGPPWRLAVATSTPHKILWFGGLPGFQLSHWSLPLPSVPHGPG